MTRSVLATIAATAVLVLASSPASAQGRWNSENARERLQSSRTPYGLCRVWINGLSRERQPAVTGCAYAYSNVPRNGRVIYGGERGQLFGRRSSPYFYDRQGDEHGAERGRNYRAGYDRDDRNSEGRSDYSYGHDNVDRARGRDRYESSYRYRSAGREDARSRDGEGRRGRGSWQSGGNTHDGDRDRGQARGRGRWE